MPIALKTSFIRMVGGRKDNLVLLTKPKLLKMPYILLTKCLLCKQCYFSRVSHKLFCFPSSICYKNVFFTAYNISLIITDRNMQVDISGFKDTQTTRRYLLNYFPLQCISVFKVRTVDNMRSLVSFCLVQVVVQLCSK